jgi:serine/threonine protein kinase
MKFTLILFGLAFGVVHKRKKSMWTVPGYKTGKMFLKKEDVFKCTKDSIVYVCKVQIVRKKGDTPMEALVYQLIETEPHESLPVMHELIDMSSNGFDNVFVLVIEYLDPQKGWMNLKDYIRETYMTNTLPEMIKIFKNIVEGIVHLFNLGVSHSDLKGIQVSLILDLNVMINKNDLKIKVIDFDFSQFFVIQGKRSEIRAGTPGYFSPEIVKGIPYNLEKNQVWQLGCVLYKLYFLNVPFSNNDQNKETLTLNIKDKMDRDIISNPNRGFKPHVMAFLEKMLEKDEVNRPTLKEVSEFNF